MMIYDWIINSWNETLNSRKHCCFKKHYISAPQQANGFDAMYQISFVLNPYHFFFDASLGDHVVSHTSTSWYIWKRATYCVNRQYHIFCTKVISNFHAANIAAPL